MIHVCYSHRTEELLAALAGRLAEEGRSVSPFEPARLVVPNRNVERYLKLGLAEAAGIAANLEVQFLREFLTRIAEEAVPGARVVSRAQSEGHLLGLLHDPAFLDGTDVTPVREYLLGAGPAPEAVDRRRCQLAAELSRLFEEYAASRPEMLAAWAAGRADASVDAPAQSWQRALWTAIFGARGLVEERSRRQGVDYLGLAEMIRLAEGTVPAGRPVHVFGVSYMARGYHRMLAAVARRREVRVYTLNPCREFWEDLETVGEQRRRLKKERARLFPPRAEARQPGLLLGDDPLGLAGEGEPLALRLWGRPARENVRLLNQLTDGDFDGRFDGPRPATLLGRLQADILDRAVAPEPGARADGSLAVLRCPGRRRELEVVAAEIWRLVASDPTLRFNQVAVVVPEAAKDDYLCHVGAVFGEARELPHHVVDLPLGGGHRLGEAVELLLAAPLGGFSRRELLPLLTHPAVLGRFPEAAPGQWLRLCEELGIVHGADHGDHAGTYIERDLVNWDQGLRRLALGALMAGPRAGDPRPVAFGAQEYLPADVPPEAGGVLSFALLARSLIADARFAAGKDGAPRERPLPEWLELLRGMLTSYLVPTDDEEEALLGRCLAALQELEDVHVGRAVSYRVAAELARQSFSRLGGARGQYLARGVTVASFVPMRAIPFRVVFVLGLGHGLFPAPPRRGQLDLREGRRTPGDVTPREQDLYLFLETLMCARDRLILSYVARDELTGEALPPSSVILELREILAQGYLAPDELRALFEAPAPPLRRYDDGERLRANPLARREHVARELGRSLRAALPAGTAAPDLPALRRGLPPAVVAGLERRLSVHRPEGVVGARRPLLVVPLAAIRQFLEDPLQGSARFRLRLREVEGDEALLEREDEAFETGALGRTGLLREVMTAALLGGETRLEGLLAGYDRLALREELAGRLPTGIFRTAERKAHQHILAGWLEVLLGLAGGGPFGRRVARFGSAGAAALGGAAALLGSDSAGEAHPPIRLAVDAPDGRVELELVGRSELLVAPAGGAPGSLILVCRRDSEARDKERLRAFLDHLALSAAGLSSGAHRSFVAWARGDERELHRARFRPVTAERARAYLGAIVAEMLTGARDAAGAATGVHDYLLPCEAVFEARRSGRGVIDEVERLRDLYYERPFLVPLSSVVGPVPEAVERHEPPARAEEMARERFELFFDLLALEEDGS